jgi:hypothetical protein
MKYSSLNRHMWASNLGKFALTETFSSLSLKVR